jgi:hypothetical protein
MEKQIITFSASEQTLTKTGGIDHYASNTVSYVQAIFDLGENWAGFDSVRAVFKTPYKTKPAVLDHSGRCLVPFEVLKYKCKVLVNLVGSISEEGVLTDRLTSYPTEALTIDANASVDNSETAISATEFEEFVAIVSDDADRAEAGATASEASADSAEASAESALASAQASEASAIRASNSASDASASAQTAQEEAQKITGMVVVVTQLPEGATPTSDWSDGVLTIGIPKGDTGETGATGNGIESAVLNADYTLTLTFTDGTSYTTPSIRGATGATGATGNGISSVTLTSTSGAVKTYTIAFTDGTNTTFDVTDGEVTQAVLDEEITALKSELTNEGVVQGSQGLVSDSKISDSVPYVFRQTADGQRVGNVLYEEIVGGTVAFNQLIQNGNFETNSAWDAVYGLNSISNNELTYSPTAIGAYYYTNQVVQSNLSVPTNHVVFFTAETYAPYNNGFYMSLRNNRIGMSGVGISNATPTPNQWSKFAKVAKLPSILTDVAFYWSMDTNYAVGDSVKLKNVWLCDLTQMFGSTIADHLYSLEQATAGAGVAVFRKMFPNSYYPYSAGELKSVEGLTSHDTTGFNAWDEEWELGSYNASGEKVSVSTVIRSTNRVRVLPGTNYYFNKPNDVVVSRMCFYDAEGAHIDGGDISLNNSRRSFSTPANAHYLAFTLSATYGTTYKSDICINISSDRNGTYEPYVKRTYALDSTLTLRGVPKLSDGKIYYDGDVYKSDGSVTRKYGIRAYQSGDESLADAITDETNTVYKLTTPTTETAEPYTSPQIVDRYGTEEYVTTGIVPIGHNSKYSEDLKGKIESLPWDFSTLIAPTETTNKASRNYTTGSLLIMNNVLYKVTANIQSGGTITPNTNVTATTLSEVIANL